MHNRKATREIKTYFTVCERKTDIYTWRETWNKICVLTFDYVPLGYREMGGVMFNTSAYCLRDPFHYFGQNNNN